jgi:hypothetical protein
LDDKSEAPPGDAQGAVLVHVSFLDDPLTMHEAIPGIVDSPQMPDEIRIKGKAVGLLEGIDLVWHTEPVEALPLPYRCLVPISTSDWFGSIPDTNLPHRKHHARLFEEAADGFSGIA